MKKVPYTLVVGNSMYSMICTRPDIAHVASLVSQFLLNIGNENWEAIKLLLELVYILDMGNLYWMDNRSKHGL